MKRTPAWSGLLSFAVGLVLGCYGAFVGHWGLVKSVLVILPTSAAIFLATRAFDGADARQGARRDGLFARLDRPVNVADELRGSSDRTAPVFRFLSWTTAGVGVASLLLILYILAGLVGGPATAWLANRTSKHRALIFSTTIYALMLIVIPLMPVLSRPT